MKKSCLFFIFVVLLVQYVFSQGGFELYIDEKNVNDVVNYTIEVENSYIISGYKYDPLIGEVSIPVFLKTTTDGEIISQVEFYKQDTGTNIRFGFQKPNGNLLYFGNSFASSDLTNVKWVHTLELSMNLELIWEKIDTLPISKPFVTHYIKNHLFTKNEEVIIQGITDTASPGTGHTSNLCLYKYGLDGNLLLFKYYPGLDDYSVGSELLYNADSTGFYLFGTLAYNSIVTDWAYFDLDLNLISTGVIENNESYFSSPVTVRRLSDGRIVMANYLSVIDSINHKGFEMRIYNDNLDLLNSKIVFANKKVYIPVNRGMGFFEEDKIWVAVFDYIPPTGIPGIEDIHFYLFNTDLKLQGTYVYEGNSRFWLYDLLPCTDGGCLVAGLVPEYDGSEKLDGFVLKVGLDEIVSTSEHFHQYSTNSFKYTATNGFLTIYNIEETGLLTLYSLSGQFLTKLYLEKGSNQFEINHLPSGIYIATLETRQQLLTTKIFIQ